MRVIVVGAGIIGASIAWNLSRRGAEVVVIENGAPAASSSSFGWVNASFYADDDHHRLRVAGMAAYVRLRDALPDLPIRTCGALWWEDQGAELHGFKAQLDALDYPVDMLTKSAAAILEPDLTHLPPEVLRFPTESAAEASAVAANLLTASGAQVLSGLNVLAIAETHGAVSGVETDTGHIAASRVVVAAGIGAPRVLDSVGVTLPMLTRPGVLVTTKPVKALISNILVTPHGEVRQLPDGRLLASAVANHQGDDASEIADLPEDIAARVLGWLGPMIAGETLEWDRVTLAYRPVPQDGLPVIGAAGPQGLHIAVMHSGVTLAAVTGEVVAREVFGGSADQELLAAYRPARFQ